MCADIAALVRERWGRGPRRSRAYWAGRDILLVLLDDSLTESERTLASHGRGAHVLEGRRTLSELAEDELRGIVESATQRGVAAVLTQSHLDPDVTAIVFLMSDADGPGDLRVDHALRRAAEQTDSARAVIAQSEQAARVSSRRREASEAARARRRATGD